MALKQMLLNNVTNIYFNPTYPLKIWLEDKETTIINFMFDLTLAAFTFGFFINKVSLSEYYNKER